MGQKKSPQSITLKHDDLLHATEHEAFFSSILSIKVDGKTQKVVIKALQRHPFKSKLLHADFLRVREDVTITMQVPLHIINESDAPGVSAGGEVSQLINEIEIACLPKDLPEHIDVDIAALELDTVLHLSEITLPKGVTIPALEQGEAHDAGVVIIHMPKANDTEELADTVEDASDESASDADSASDD